MNTRFAARLMGALAAVSLAAGVASAQAPAAGARRPGLAMLTVTSTSFADGAEIPAKFAGAQGISPQLSWSGAPEGTAAYVLIMHDVDVAVPAGNLAGDITHWVVYNIPAATTSIPEGGPIPSGSGQLSMRGPQYMGPAPPAGHPFHHYVFQVYALNAPLALTGTPTRADIEKAMDGKIVARGAYVGRAKPAQ
ncbi:MAG: YbhB/YbcL family Raf kinase inhibitor-like protein [Vicinamibacterales bacterium]